MKKYKKVLVVKNRALGDAIMGLGALQYLRSELPNAEIHYGVPSWVAPLFMDVKVAADKIVPIQVNTLREFFSLLAFLRHEKYDLIYELFQTGRLKRIFSLYSYFSHAEYAFHNHHLDYEGRKRVYQQGVIRPNIQRDLDGLYTLFKKKEVPDFLHFTPKMIVKKKIIRTGQIIFGVVATRETKKWPLEYFFRLSELLDDKEILVPLSLNSEDQKLKEKILAEPRAKKWSILETPLELLPESLARASCYVGNDTGLKHLCVALGLPTLTFFGPEPPLEWHPYSEEEHPFLYREGLDCRTKEAHFCGLQTCESMVCLNEILPEKAYQFVKKLV